VTHNTRNRPFVLALLYTRFAQALKKWQILDKSLKMKNCRHSEKKTHLRWLFLEIIFRTLNKVFILATMLVNCSNMAEAYKEQPRGSSVT